ncbi:hypothetical protein EPUL_002966 [Erysiphe pulchra]|uniref:Exocyst complex component Sec8 n=1 Tax=Erysiphe pulchra TaxID=225359 RepID=A0A2S4PUQ5_9PEZI|nr:hypothetical protein EPUL_002966 [Erysiphe pulchra]
MSRSRYEDPTEPSPLINEGNDYSSYEQGNGQQYGSPTSKSSYPRKTRNGQSRPRVDGESRAGKQIVAVLENIKREWPSMCEKECVPVQIAIQLLDTSSVGRAHEYRQFEQTHKYLQDSLKAIVHENHQGFNSSIGTYHKIQTSLQSAQKRVRNLKDSMIQSKANIATTDPELKKLATASQQYGDLIQVLSEIEELRLVPDQLEARISEKRFITAVDILQAALRRIRVPVLDEIGALSEIRSYLANQENTLVDVLIEELHDHLYLKSPYCQERWQMIAESTNTLSGGKVEDLNSFVPFHEILDSLDLSETVVENPSINPEADSFYYIELLVESLNKLGRLELAVNKIKQRLPVELFVIVNETNSEVDQKHPTSLRGNTTSNSVDQGQEKNIRADIISDLLWTLYAKFESIAENHRIFHEAIKAVSRREGIQNPLLLLSGFRELWNLYQSEIQSLLHSYVTTDADIYESNPMKSGILRQGLKKEQLFRFSDTDIRSAQMEAEYQELEEIIRSTVPGLITSENQGSDTKKLSKKLEKNPRKMSSRQRVNTSGYDDLEIGSHKSLVEPSVFNMSLLLSPTLEFLQRLKMIVPPGSDIVTGTLTLFLDNFLVNVFLPQLDETLGKLGNSLFEESDAFQQDPRWAVLSRRPLFKGTSAFFHLITQFSRMLNNIPHDQALSQLIIAQMKRYFDHCNTWFQSLTSNLREPGNTVLKLSVSLASNPGDVHDIIKNLWNSLETSNVLDEKQIEIEVSQLIRRTNEIPLQLDDIILDKETISSLCMLYTSMKWLAIKIKELRYITSNHNDSSRTAMKKQNPRQWSLSNNILKDQVEQVRVYLPMTKETVAEFDSVISSYEDLALRVLLTLHMEVRCQTIFSIVTTFSPEKTASYLLEQPIKEPDSKILALNSDILCFDETIVKLLPQNEVSFVRSGLGLLVDDLFVAKANMLGALNANGCGRIQLNIFVLQQNLKIIEPEINLKRSSKFFDLFNQGPEAVVRFAKEDKQKSINGKNYYNYDELKTLIELCYSEPILNSEKTGSTITVKRSKEDQLLQLSEIMW